MSRVAELAARRDGLLLRSAALRQQLQVHTDELGVACGRIDRGIGIARRLSSRPMVLAAGGALLLALGPFRAFRWISRGLLVTSAVRRGWAMYSALRSARSAYDDQHLFV